MLVCQPDAYCLFDHMIENTPLLQMLAAMLHAKLKTEESLECIFVIQNLSISSESYQARFAPCVAALKQVLSREMGLNPANLLMLKDAALKCLLCLAVDSAKVLEGWRF